jgi:nitric oxide dioxygenase
MLSPASLSIVRETLPAVGAAIPEITTLFYDKLFADHPALLSDLFNRGNQATGAQQQALAGSIARFATVMVNDPGQEPAALLGRVAHKHASLGVTADQYEIVHTYLFAAIADVLGAAVTPEVAAAWDEVYWLMARTLIDLEAGLYREAGREPGPNWQPWKVLARHQETADVVSFILRPDAGEAAPFQPEPFRPGQYVSVAVTLPDGARQIRQYSFSSAPERASRRITIKRVRDGEGPDGEISTWLHANVAVGDVLTLSPPYGNVVLDEGDSPLLLASAGVGCTPIIGILDHLVETSSERPVTVVHADRSIADHPLRWQLHRSVSQLPNATAHIWYEQAHPGWPSEYTGLSDLSDLDLAASLNAYICGPVPFIDSIRKQLADRGVPAAAIRHELFGAEIAA